MIDPITSRATIATTAASTVTAPVGTDQDRSQDQKLRQSAKDLQGVFVQQLFKAMRETVPQQEGIVSGGAGEDMFTGLLDQHLAAETPSQWEGGLAEALYRQLRGHLPGGPSSQSTNSPSSR